MCKGGEKIVITFQKKEEWFKFYDTQGNPIERKIEVRFDPLTWESSRLVADAGLKLTPKDFTELANQTSGAKCPFCSENLLKLTPVFPKELSDAGRITQGEATLFPNLFPYGKHNGVTIFSGQHYVRLEEFTVSMIKDAFIAAQTYIQKVKETDKEARYASINWNYLPYSGGSILHPHIHVIVSDSPTNYQRQLENSANQFEGGKDYYTSLYEIEKSLGERWIGEKGEVAWVTAFAPKGHNDFMAIFRNKYSIDEVAEQDWIHFAEGLKGIFSTLTEQGFDSFNMALNVSMDETSKQPINTRLIPRFSFGMLDTSDVSVFQSLHGEPLSFKTPEDVAEKARGNF
jgi:UDPglucose--hexose-1-phosphate uridylyltransferase